MTRLARLASDNVVDVTSTGRTSGGALADATCGRFSYTREGTSPDRC